MKRGLIHLRLLLLFLSAVECVPLSWTPTASNFELSRNAQFFVEDLTDDSAPDYCKEKCANNEACTGYFITSENTYCVDKDICKGVCGSFTKSYTPSEPGEIDTTVALNGSVSFKISGISALKKRTTPETPVECDSIIYAD
jgi:hypothetical protein